MEEFEYYLKKENKVIRKVVIKNNSDVTKLFKVSNNNQIIKLLLIKGNQKKEIELNDSLLNILVSEVSD